MTDIIKSSLPCDVLFPARWDAYGNHRCPARTAEGSQCANETLRGKRYCVRHQEAFEAAEQAGAVAPVTRRRA